MLDTRATRAYHRLRAQGWPAASAFIHTKTEMQFDDLGEDTVRLCIEPDEFMSYEDLEGDCYTPSLHPEIPASRILRERAAYRERIDQDGVFGIIGEYHDGREWQHCDSCWGFVGDDWQHSGYDTDIRRETIDAYHIATSEQFGSGI